MNHRNLYRTSTRPRCPDQDGTVCGDLGGNIQLHSPDRGDKGEINVWEN
ncbi:hypothetical protein M3629_25265 [Paenibacillus polysaccharolyticus]|nr:hypothetical protein [Paenibacillus polysaccharolyticus]